MEPDDEKRAATPASTEPASGGRLLIGWALVVASVVLVTLGWWGVSGSPVVAVQLTYLISGGLGGLLAGIAGVGFLVSNDIRRDRERLGRVEAAMLDLRDMVAAQNEVLRKLEEEAGARNGRAKREASKPRREARGGMQPRGE